MSLDVPLRAPSPELQHRYRAEHLWLDRSLGGFFDDYLARGADLEVRFWSETAPYRGTFGDVHREARRFAGGLQARGIAIGDVVTYQLPNRVEAMIALYGAAMAGAVVVPVVHFYGPKELQFILEQLGARVHLTTATFGSSRYLDALDGFRTDVATLEHIVLVGDGTAPWTEPFADVLSAAPLDDLPSTDPMAPAIIGYTSGTTSDPKGVVHVANSFVAEALQMKDYDVGRSRPLLTGAPLAHAMGITGGAVLPLMRHEPSHLVDRWEPDRVLAIMLEAGLSSGSGATYFLTSLFDAATFTPAHAEIMEGVGLGGSTVPGAVCDRAEDLGVVAVRSYGSTEHPTSIGAVRSDTPEHRKYTEGRPLAGCEVRIVDDAGRDISDGVAGEILSRGPDLFFGYVDPMLTRTALDRDGWYHTEDLAIRDPDGYITIADRKKDIIIRGGENISASEVEEILQRMPGVSEVAVVAAPDDRLGERGCAFVAPILGRTPPSLEDVRAHFRESGVARQKWPEELRVVDQFPRTPSGKIKKQVLRAELQDRARSTTS
ncbi:MAG TPA: AMP-binding protein [Acidimicrobiia bacterium]|jgi:acyl-CoA synthetase (AMP-forming)/AMP-acid ligase II